MYSLSKYEGGPSKKFEVLTENAVGWSTVSAGSSSLLIISMKGNIVYGLMG
jgi:hypothetical protein